MYNLCERLFPIHRSLMGEGVRESLRIIREHLPSLAMHEIPTGTECFDWIVPQEWQITSSRLKLPDGRTICRAQENPISVVQYSEPVCQSMTLKELQTHLFSNPKQPDSIPYVTSYYKRRWGFCLSQNERNSLKEGYYFAEIESTLFDGYMTLGELVIPGNSDKEILLSTYTCHPNLANDNLSGMAVATWLGKWLSNRDNRYTIRILFMPETIGAIYYISRHLERMKKNIIAGFVLTCMGDERNWSYMPSRNGNTLADRAALHVLGHEHPGFKRYAYMDRGSDERQYCAPGVDLPVCSVMRTKYHRYPEYHTDKDDLSVISEKGLRDSLEVMQQIIETIELNDPVRAAGLCEPMLSKRYMHSSLGGKARGTSDIQNILAYADGRDALDMAETLGKPLSILSSTIESLKGQGLVK